MSLSQVLTLLGYDQSSGFVLSSAFASLSNHRHALRQAAEAANIVGCFGLWSQVKLPLKRFFPIVLVAKIEDENTERVHRLVWNQGLVPFAIILTPTRLVICDGFTYSVNKKDDGKRGVLKDIELSSLNDNKNYLNGFSAHQLRSSVAWRDRAIDVGGRVDHKLLANLKQLANALTDQTSPALKIFGAKVLDIETAHSLIGRFLYLFFLQDRGILTDDWLRSRNLPILKGDTVDWVGGTFWRLFHELDEIFNGSVFPITSDSAATITDATLNFMHVVMRRADFDRSALQIRFSFAEFDFSSLRIETLSAVYEQFLHDYEASGSTLLGAHYTPPFLADYVVDQIESHSPISRKTSVLDCAAGSGVLLVAAYRRMLESQLKGRKKTLSLKLLRETLKESIFGIELMSAACHVTCFSLYLTMLDYAEPCELDILEARSESERVFPSMLGENIICANFFDASSIPNSFPTRFDCIVSNPPWKSLREDKFAAEYATAQKSNTPVGEQQISDLFVWKSLRKYLRKGGIAAFIMPSKSLLNPTGRQFWLPLSKEATFLQVTDFSNLRHLIFSGAIHPPLTMVLKNSTPSQSQKVVHYAPLRATQIGAHGVEFKRNKMWAFLVDTSEITEIPYEELHSNPNIWAESLVMRNVDRRIMAHLKLLCEEKHVYSLADWKQAGIIDYGRGREEADTGVPAKYIFSANKKDVNHYEKHLSIAAQKQLPGLLAKTIIPLPKKILAMVKPNYKRKFGGDIVLVPRSLERTYFVEPAIAFTSSFICVYFDAKSAWFEPHLLRAISKVINSEFGRYFLVLNAPRFLVDRPNIEVGTLCQLPMPFTSIKDPRIFELASMEENRVDDYLYDALRITGDYIEAIREFLTFRIDFKDGQIPERATETADQQSINRYTARLGRQLSAMVGRYGRYEINVESFAPQGLALIEAQFVADKGSPLGGLNVRTDELIDEYNAEGINPISMSFALKRDEGRNSVYVVKPLQQMHWTIERSINDGRQIMAMVSSSEGSSKWLPNAWPV